MADIVVRHGSDFIKSHLNRILPSHLHAMRDITTCRTEVKGGRTWFCADCDKTVYSYHSCGNRHCPLCGNDKTDQWLDHQSRLILPAHYFMVTVTLPHELNAVAKSNQKKVYSLFFKTSAEAIRELAMDKRFVGGAIGMMGVLQTWTRILGFHLHIHYLVPGIGISKNGKKIKKTKKDFFVHREPLAKRFKGKFKAALEKEGLINQIPKAAWMKKWNIDVEPVGSGEAALKYLAPYVFRVAISNNNILSLKGGKVTFRYRESKTNIRKTMTLEAHEFIRRFLQHVLPKGFVKVRYYGFMATKKRALLDKIKERLGKILSPVRKLYQKASKPFCCPSCGKTMAFIGELPRKRGPPQWMWNLNLQRT